jgi:hypothetical protein
MTEHLTRRHILGSGAAIAALSASKQAAAASTIRVYSSAADNGKIVRLYGKFIQLFSNFI